MYPSCESLIYPVYSSLGIPGAYRIPMAKKSSENRIIIHLRSSESGATYTTIKNKRNDPSRIELKKYDPVLRKHVTFKETK